MIIGARRLPRVSAAVAVLTGATIPALVVGAEHAALASGRYPGHRQPRKPSALAVRGSSDVSMSCCDC